MSLFDKILICIGILTVNIIVMDFCKFGLKFTSERATKNAVEHQSVNAFFRASLLVKMQFYFIAMFIMLNSFSWLQEELGVSRFVCSIIFAPIICVALVKFEVKQYATWFEKRVFDLQQESRKP